MCTDPVTTVYSPILRSGPLSRVITGVKNMFGLHLEISPGVNSGNAKGVTFTEIELSPGIKTILAVA